MSIWILHFIAAGDFLHALERVDDFSWLLANFVVFTFRSECFSTDYFWGCVQSLLLVDETDELRKMVDFLGKK